MSAELVDGWTEEGGRDHARWLMSPFTVTLVIAVPVFAFPSPPADPEQRFNQAPPDLIVLLCHFTN